MQGVDNLFEVDTVRHILDTVCAIAGVRYGADKQKDISIRVITDHIHSASFMICDGVTPSNEGRGYVLRRILRRASRHGKLLGINRAFLTELCDVVVEENKGAYPELFEKRDYVKKVIEIEEERFDATIDAGLNILSELMNAASATAEKVIAGSEVFKLYDTFGFPIDLTREIAEENGLTVDEAAFQTLMQAQKKRAREARANVSGWSEASKTLLSDLPKTEFTGYNTSSCEGKIIAILVDNESVDSVNEGECCVILDRTCFYGEGGGQVGDTGVMEKNGAALIVNDTKKTDGVYLHLCTVKDGVFAVGDTVTAAFYEKRRDAIRRNHSCCHLLQAALRTVLGAHVEQAGSYVDENGFRFDFAHFSAMTAEELNEVERIVNDSVLAGAPIVTTETDVETAKKAGAMALFGEKYGKVVRMVKMGDFSTELCGGTHMDNTARIGLFKILSESSVAAGVRRIEGTTGLNVLKLIEAKQALLNETAAALKVANVNDVAAKAVQTAAELKAAHASIAELESKMAGSQAEELIASAPSVNGLRLIALKKNGLSVDAARNLTDCVREKAADAVIVLAVINGEKLNFVAACGASAVKKGANAGTLVREAATLTGGKGGGRPDSAMAGGKDGCAADAALNKVKEMLEAL